jgi:hypothetical protein
MGKLPLMPLAARGQKKTPTQATGQGRLLTRLHCKDSAMAMPVSTKRFSFMKQAQMPTGSTTTGTSTYNPGLFDYMSLGLSF